MQASIFTRIIKRELPSEIIYEDARTIVILTLEPHNPGHMLVIPKVQVDRFYDLKDVDYQAVMKVAKAMSVLVQEVFNPARVGLAAVGFEVPHVHLHVIPMNAIADIDHTKARPASREELKAVGDRLRASLKKEKSE